MHLDLSGDRHAGFAVDFFQKVDLREKDITPANLHQVLPLCCQGSAAVICSAFVWPGRLRGVSKS